MIKGKSNKLVTSRNYSDGRVSRTQVGRHFPFRTTFNAGFLFPIFAEEVYPSQIKSINCGELVRGITPLGPVMDNSFLDIFFFFVPNRLIWDHWEEFIAGYNKEAWTQDVVYTVPKIIMPSSYDGDITFATNDYPDVTTETIEGVTYNIPTANSFVHSFLDYLPGACDICELAKWYKKDVEAGADTYIDSWNEGFAISALFPRAYVKIWNDWFRDENLQDELELYTGDNDELANEFAFDLLDARALPKAAKYHNRFTSALPQPVKGPDVLIPMNNLPVQVTSLKTDEILQKNLIIPRNDYTKGQTINVVSGAVNQTDVTNPVANNTSNTIRMLRLATQTELLLARDARGGTRYVESLLSHFGVHNGDARLQRSEYLGSKQIPLTMQQITNTAASSGNPLGSVGAQSVTRDNSHYFKTAFTEHGIVFGVAVVRTNISYSSGVRKQYQRFGRFDYIWPEFKHIGDVPLYTKELDINVQMAGAEDMVFGYTPYGSELREGYSYNNGLFRYKADGNLSYLTYQEKYLEDTPPYLSSAWIKQPTDVVYDTMVDQNGPQFYALFDIYSEDVIPLDPTSDPGLMDHF